MIRGFIPGAARMSASSSSSSMTTPTRPSSNWSRTIARPATFWKRRTASFATTGGARTKKLWTQKDPGDEINVFEAMNEQEEGVFLATTIQNAVKAKKRKLSEFAVLYRTNAQSRVLEEVFINYRIPYKIVGGLKFYERREIKDLICYLRLVFNPYDSVSLRRVINVPTRGIGTGSLQKIEKTAAEKGVSLWAAVSLAGAGEVEGIRGTTRKGVESFVSLIAYLHGKLEEYPVTRVLQELLGQYGLPEGTGAGKNGRGADAGGERQGTADGHAAVRADDRSPDTGGVSGADRSDRRHR